MRARCTLKSVIICKSVHHNNALRVAQAMADELGADIFTPEEVDNDLLQQYDLIGFGSGIHNGRHYRSLVNVIKELDSLSEKAVFVFYTSGFERFPSLPCFDEAITSKLEKAGVNIKGIFSCRGWQTWGPSVSMVEETRTTRTRMI